MQTVPGYQDAFEEFLLCKQAQGRAERTLHDYRYHVGKFFAAYPEAWPDFLPLKKDAYAFFAVLADKSATTHNLSRGYLKAFFAWCVEEGYLSRNSK